MATIETQERLSAGRHTPIIVVLNSAMTMGEAIEELALIWTVSESEEYTDLLHYLPLRR